ncbi:Small auxin-up RNA protein [Dioscorea alata]|uniref:Small auxin-up RNA protein n=1 Tax=Dioscorea alata TaxID=55571 RepID=A0ACB7WVE1_DIOAL|nr:Small auxin-up RNA protein [Dioscorea alata]
MARKLLKVPSLKRMISSPRADTHSDFNACSTASVAEKGHFNVYTSEGKCFMVPLAYLDNSIFKELLRISEEEFGLPCDGPITLPCDAASMSNHSIPSLFTVEPPAIRQLRFGRASARRRSDCSTGWSGTKVS